MVNIIDVNDERPQFEQSEYTFHVSEHVSAYTEVGIVSAVDRDEPPYNTFTLSLKPASSETEDFIIDPITGRLSTTKPFDRELQVISI
jgi:hypothetical protein